MWTLVVMVLGMAVYTQAGFQSYSACMTAGKLKAIELAKQGKMGATYACTESRFKPKRRR